MLREVVRNCGPGRPGFYEDMGSRAETRIVVETPHGNDGSPTCLILERQRPAADTTERMSEPLSVGRFEGAQVLLTCGVPKGFERYE